jgi:hypothetical protein
MLRIGQDKRYSQLIESLDVARALSYGGAFRDANCSRANVTFGSKRIHQSFFSVDLKPWYADCISNSNSRA